MNFVIPVYKQKGETPLQALHRLRAERPEYKDETLSYAGRLDPLAGGVMLVLVGEANKEREKYLSLDKTYVAEILCGISTDTHDLLGLVTEIKQVEVGKDKFTEVIGSFMGKFFQKYPAYSSKTVDGAQMHELSRRGGVFDIPAHEVSVHALKILTGGKVNGSEILRNALLSVDLITGDFRQKEIKDKWTEVLTDNKSEFDLFKVELSVSSGFYVRQFASDIGEKLGVPALAYSIRRVKAGKWGLDDCL